MVDAARLGDLDVLWSSGGNFLDVLPAPDITRTALTRAALRIHQDIVLTHQMLVEPGEVVVLLPAATRYEQEGGGTSTTTERRVAFSPEIPGPRVGRRAASGGSSPTSRGACDPSGGALRLRIGRRDPGRDRARRPRVRRHRAPAGDGRRDPDRRRPLVRGRRVPDAGRSRALRRRHPSPARCARRSLRAVDPARQAVQHDGVERRRPADRRAAMRCSWRRATRPRWA